ncbi:MAG: hypothetical protein L0Y66_26750, partial [Myxococcaceae bacterium]|nr:hypothetical protein [Myxococcaceae bacterium]
MRRADLQTDSPSAQEVIESLERLNFPAADTLAEVAQLLRRTEEPSESGSSTAWPPLLQHAHSKHDARHAEPASSHRPLVGPPLVLAKRTFR